MLSWVPSDRHTDCFYLAIRIEIYKYRAKMSNEKCFTTAPLGLMQIGFDYFTGKDLCRREFLPESSESLYRNQGIVLATAWDKVLIQHG